MTEEQGDQEIRKSEDAPGGEEKRKESDTTGGAQSPRRKRRLTLLDVDSVEFQKVRQLLSQDGGAAKERKDVEKAAIEAAAQPATKQPLTKQAATKKLVPLPKLNQAATRKLKPLVAEQAATKKLKPLRGVSRTLVDEDLPVPLTERLHVDLSEAAPALEAAAAADPVEEAKPKKIRRSERFVAKTMLDCDVLATTLLRYNERKRELAEEEARLRALLPPVEYVDSDRKALPCPWKWDDDNSGERARHCEQCHLRVYDFEEMELEEAEALIFTMENKRNPTLFKREDGKFMTQDCPVAVKRKRQRLLVSIAAGVLFLGLVTALILNPPKFSAPATTFHVDTDESEHSEIEIGSKKDGAGLTKEEEEAELGLQRELTGRGHRQRPTFTPADEDKYWE